MSTCGDCSTCPHLEICLMGDTKPIPKNIIDEAVKQAKKFLKSLRKK
jgi:hypothetical protein